MAPKVLRPNSEYHVAVSTQGTTSATTVVVDVGGKQDSGGVLKVTQFVKVDPYSTRIVRLEVSALPIYRANRLVATSLVVPVHVGETKNPCTLPD